MHVLANTMQQEQIPLPPVASIALIYTACRQTHTHSMECLSTASNIPTAAFNINTISPNCNAMSMHVPKCALTFATIPNLSLL
jgi:hypothetical protein